MKKQIGFFIISMLLISLLAPLLVAAGDITFEAANGYVEYSDFGWQNYTKLYQLDANGSIVPALYRGDEANLPAYLDATLFCPLDDLDTATNTTTCYLNGAEQNATVYFNESTGYPRLVSGVIGNALEFDGAVNEYVTITTDNMTMFSIYGYVKLTGEQNQATTYDHLVLFGFPYRNPSAVFIKNTGEIKVSFTYADDTAEYKTTGIVLQPGRWYGVGFVTDGQTFAKVVVVSDDVQTWTYSLPQPLKTLTTPTADFRIGGTISGLSIKAIIDEVRLYENKLLTDDEIQLLYHINRHKFATLNAPSATFDGSQFLVNVTATLPSDGGSYLLPAPASAISSYSSAGTIGNFTFLQVGTASTASFQIPVPKDLTPPAGIRFLSWFYGDQIYITAQDEVFPTEVTITNLPKGVWYAEEGDVSLNQVLPGATKLIIANLTAPSTIYRYPDLIVDPLYQYINITVIKKSSDETTLAAAAPPGESVVFTIDSLYENAWYKLLIDSEVNRTFFVTDDRGITFLVDGIWDNVVHMLTLDLIGQLNLDVVDKTLTVARGSTGCLNVHFNNPTSETQYYTITINGGFLNGTITQSAIIAPLTSKDVSVFFTVPEDVNLSTYTLNVAVYQGDELLFHDNVTVTITDGEDLNLLSGGPNTSVWAYALVGLLVVGGLVFMLRRRR